jgi:hypothetical protein
MEGWNWKQSISWRQEDGVIVEVIAAGRSHGEALGNALLVAADKGWKPINYEREPWRRQDEHFAVGEALADRFKWVGHLVFDGQGSLLLKAMPKVI